MFLQVCFLWNLLVLTGNFVLRLNLRLFWEKNSWFWIYSIFKTPEIPLFFFTLKFLFLFLLFFDEKSICLVWRKTFQKIFSWNNRKVLKLSLIKKNVWLNLNPTSLNGNSFILFIILNIFQRFRKVWFSGGLTGWGPFLELVSTTVSSSAPITLNRCPWHLLYCVPASIPESIP